MTTKKNSLINIKENTAYASKWSKSFLSTWIDSEFLPSVNRIQAKSWDAMTVADTLNPMEAEWLSDALTPRGFSEIIGLSFEFNRETALDIVAVDRDSILTYNYEHSYKYICLTHLDADFLYFKDQANRFFLLCGNSDFVENAFKCSYDTAKLMFFDYWVESDFNSQQEKEYLTRIWGRYSERL